ncbi:MAG TPA: class I adenylate-forming enzyme family protein [Acidimicrobiales bacterium]|nr:class I adenylate-forming enzyme family protein [Acidimicrobiales bacterium]
MSHIVRTESFPPFTPTSGELIRRCAERWGDAPFVVLGDERLTYAQADARSAVLGKGLLVSGVGKSTPLGLLAPNGPDWVVAWLAATRIGALVALLNTYGQARELGRALRHGDVAHLLTVGSHLGHDYLGRLEAAAPGLAEQRHERLLLPSHPYLRSVWTWGAGRSGDRPWCGDLADLVDRGSAVPDRILAEVEAEVRPSDPMVMVFSSGSTADPKAVVHTQGATIRHAHNLNQLRDLRPDDVIYTPMPLFWVGGLSFALVAAMHAGASIVFEERFEPGATLELLERERVTQVLGWPHMAKALADHPSRPDRDLSSIRSGAATALPAPADRDPPGPRATSLGMTETLGPHTFEEDAPLPAGKVGSFGRPVPGVEHRVVDPETLDDVPAGQVGEVWVRGYPLMVGLHKRERADTFTADGWYRTGDAGHLDGDGHLFFAGRLGDVIKSAGMNVTPREVEAALEEQPEVALAIVTGIDHPDRGQDVVAAVALNPGASLDAAAARERLRTELAAYKVPRHVAVFPSQADLPLLASGKVDRRRLAQILGDRFGRAPEQRSDA